MNINELESELQKHKEKFPSTCIDTVDVTIPFYIFHKKIKDGIDKLQEEKYKITNTKQKFSIYWLW